MNPIVIEALDKIGWPEWHFDTNWGVYRERLRKAKVGWAIDRFVLDFVKRWKHHTKLAEAVAIALIEKHLRETLAKLDDTISIVPVSGGLWWEAVQAPDIYLAYTIVNGWHWTDADAHDFDSYAECAARAVLAVATPKQEQEVTDDQAKAE